MFKKQSRTQWFLAAMFIVQLCTELYGNIWLNCPRSFLPLSPGTWQNRSSIDSPSNSESCKVWLSAGEPNRCYEKSWMMFIENSLKSGSGWTMLNPIPLKNDESQWIGMMIIPNIWKNKRCAKPAMKSLPHITAVATFHLLIRTWNRTSSILRYFERVFRFKAQLRNQFELCEGIVSCCGLNPLLSAAWEINENENDKGEWSLIWK